MDVFVELKAVISDFQAKMAAARGEMDATAKHGGSSLAGLGKASGLALGGIAVAAVSVGAVSVKMAADFQQSMSKLVTSGGESAKNLKSDMAGVETLMASTGTSASQLAAGLYTINSAGFHGAAGLTVLKAAAQGAKTENADLVPVTDGLTTMLNDYGLKANQAALVTSKMVEATSLGKTTFADLAGSLHTVSPAANAAGISMNQVLGAMATMTAKGTPAADAATYLRQTILQLENPSQKAADEMRALGLNAVDVSKNLGTRGLTGTLELLTNAIKSKMGPAGTVLVDNLKQAAAAGSGWATKLAQMTPAQKAQIESLAAMGVAANKTRVAMSQMSTTTTATGESQQAATTKLQSAALRLQTAEAHLTATEASLAGKSKVTASEQVSLADAHTRVTVAAKAVTEAQTALAGSHVKVASASAASQKQLAEYNAQLQALPPAARSVLEGLIASKEGFNDLNSTIAKLPPTEQTAVGALATMVGGTKSMQAALELTGTSAATFTANVQKVSGATTDAKGNVAGWAIVQQNFNQKLAEAKETANEMAIRLGTALLPVVTKLAVKISELAVWMTKNKTTTEVLAIVIGTTLVAAFVASTIAAMSFWTAATLGLVPAIAALVVGIIYLASHWKQVWSDIQKFTKTYALEIVVVMGLLLGPMGVLIAVALLVLTHWNAVWNGMKAVAGNVVGFIIGDVIKPIAAYFLWMAGSIVDSAARAFGWVPGIGGKLKAAAASVDAFRAEVSNTLSGTANDAYSWGNQIGGNLTAGMATGMTKNIENTLRVGAATAASVAAAMRKGAQVASPSRLTIEIGRQLMAGLNVGMAEGLPGTTQFAASASASTAGAMTEAGSGGGGGSGGGDVVVTLFPNSGEFARVAGPVIRQWMNTGPARNSTRVLAPS